jgi:hypothetical protein
MRAKLRDAGQTHLHSHSPIIPSHFAYNRSAHVGLGRVFLGEKTCSKFRTKGLHTALQASAHATKNNHFAGVDDGPESLWLPIRSAYSPLLDPCERMPEMEEGNT